MKRLDKTTTELVSNITNLPPQNCSCFNGNFNNCTCCLTFATVPFTCAANSTKYSAVCLPFVNVTTNLKQLTCNYTNNTNKVVTPENCTCANITSNGKNFLNCSCCVKNEVPTPPVVVPPFTCANNAVTSNCSCQNITSQDKKSWSYTCDCLRRVNKDTTEWLTSITRLSPQNCSCFNGNFSNCTCCLTLTTVPFTCGLNTIRYNASCLPFFNTTSKANLLSCNYTNATNKVLLPENCSCQNLTINGKN